MKTRIPPVDQGLQQIADLERDIVRAHDERMAFENTDPAEAKRRRPGAVALARAVGDRLRADYAARGTR